MVRLLLQERVVESVRDLLELVPPNFLTREVVEVAVTSNQHSKDLFISELLNDSYLDLYRVGDSFVLLGSPTAISKAKKRYLRSQARTLPLSPAPTGPAAPEEEKELSTSHSTSRRYKYWRAGVKEPQLQAWVLLRVRGVVICLSKVSST